ncbi:TIGR02757 family protein [Arcobacter sp. F2176]|uniref:TIGR02757 family protein n=1 Tax=Arcobacter sp. F2176 TaxID=2044511 RepID=UPI00100B0487|nr:TIGR02757 family protein [Arcobacter sp. F2176]RXJ79694.1 TIGR02757 family protein [Arcobacter sp. F2176]
MNKKDIELKNLLDIEVANRNNDCELTLERPDPLFIAKRHNDEYISLICALFAYGKASLIIKFLDSLDFSLLNKDEQSIRKSFEKHYYRFQNSKDIQEFFIALSRLKKQTTLNELFVEKYKINNNVCEGIDNIISKINEINPHTSQGYKFLLGSNFKRDKQNNIKQVGNAAYKRWFMYLRWMVRKDNLDMGLWSGVSSEDLLMPLDTHTFNVSNKLGLISRNNCDLYASYLLTKKLKQFDKNDPIKYDFALYRIGQEKLIESNK